MDENLEAIPNWMLRTLKFAGYYNLAWGVYILSRPQEFYQLLNPSDESIPIILYPFGGAVMLFGLFYLFAAQKPFKYLPLIALGFLSKLFGPLVGYLVLLGAQPNYFNFGLHIVFNDLLWLIPLGLILYRSFKEWQNTELEVPIQFPDILQQYRDQNDKNLAQLNQEKKLLMVFLRHFGCTFCKEALTELKRIKNDIESEELKIVFVHMAEVKEAQAYFKKYGLEDSPQISDPNCSLYRAFDLKRGSFKALFGLKSWKRGFQAGVLQGQGIGKLVGDGFRMPGVFLIHKGNILQSFRHQNASDRPDYQALAACTWENPSLKESAQ